MVNILQQLQTTRQSKFGLRIVKNSNFLSINTTTGCMLLASPLTAVYSLHVEMTNVPKSGTCDPKNVFIPSMTASATCMMSSSMALVLV